MAARAIGRLIADEQHVGAGADQIEFHAGCWRAGDHRPAVLRLPFGERERDVGALPDLREIELEAATLVDQIGK